MDGLFDWYWVGVALGLGVAAGTPGPRRESRLFGAFVLVAAAASGVIAALATGWAAIAVLVGVAIGVFSFRHLAHAAVLAAAVALAAVAFVPALGYVAAVVAPFLGERLRRRASGRYAGLRILAKD